MTQLRYTQDEARAKIKQSGIIAIIRGAFAPDEVIAVSEVLIRRGIVAVECTLNCPDAGALIQSLKTRYGDAPVIVGAGTVRTVDDVKYALDHGAEFLVSPNFDPASVALSQEQGVLHIVGVYTPSEAQSAFCAGCKMVKLFPANFGGPEYLKSLRAPLDDIEWVPTGGVNPGNMGAWRRAGASAVGSGHSLVGSGANDLAALEDRARRWKIGWDQAG